MAGRRPLDFDFFARKKLVCDDMLDPRLGFGMWRQGSEEDLSLFAVFQKCGVCPQPDSRDVAP